jgi:hypothetical protein
MIPLEFIDDPEEFAAEPVLRQPLQAFDPLLCDVPDCRVCLRTIHEEPVT